jgi:hypothetical protein
MPALALQPRHLATGIAAVPQVAADGGHKDAATPSQPFTERVLVNASLLAATPPGSRLRELEEPPPPAFLRSWLTSCIRAGALPLESLPELRAQVGMDKGQARALALNAAAILSPSPSAAPTPYAAPRMLNTAFILSPMEASSLLPSDTLATLQAVRRAWPTRVRVLLTGAGHFRKGVAHTKTVDAIPTPPDQTLVFFVDVDNVMLDRAPIETALKLTHAGRTVYYPEIWGAKARTLEDVLSGRRRDGSWWWHSYGNCAFFKTDWTGMGGYPLKSLLRREWGPEDRELHTAFLLSNVHSIRPRTGALMHLEHDRIPWSVSVDGVHIAAEGVDNADAKAVLGAQLNATADGSNSSKAALKDLMEKAGCSKKTGIVGCYDKFKKFLGSDEVRKDGE